MSAQRNTPVVNAPSRSQTDAAAERRKQRIQLPPQGASHFQDAYSSSTPTSLPYDNITLPRGRRKLSPEKLGQADFNRCQEPWALSNISSWIREMAEGENDLKKNTVEECLARLFSHKLPSMNIGDAEALATQIVQSMFSLGILIPEEEWVKWGPGHMSGVLWQLTSSGCYSPRVHNEEVSGRCYSYACHRHVKKVDLDGLKLAQSPSSALWDEFYKEKLAKEENVEKVKNMPRKELSRQRVMHEIMAGEEEYIGQLDVLRILYRDGLRQCHPPVISPGKIDKFISAVFGRVENVRQCNKADLLDKLKGLQKDEGPFIVGIASSFGHWIKAARTFYIDYSYAYEFAQSMVRKEQARNVLFNKFLQEMQAHPLAKRLDYNHYLYIPITRLMRYTLLLGDVKSKTDPSSEEYGRLEKVIEAIHKVTKECDAKVDEMKKKLAIMELEQSLILRPGFHAVLHLDQMGRELLHQGELQRQSSKGVKWVEAYALLLDHYFILAKKVEGKGPRSSRKYDVSKEPIPMPLLFLDSEGDDPIAKQKGLPTPLTRTTATGLDSRLAKYPDRPPLDHTTANPSVGSASRLNTRDGGYDARTLFPFRVKHLGHETYTLFAKDVNTRQEWVNHIKAAKKSHAKALQDAEAEPFSFRVISDTAFAYETGSAFARSTPVWIEGTPLHRAIHGREQTRREPPVCSTQVNCATRFATFGRDWIAVGTDSGVYISDANNPGDWTKTCRATKVTQIAVLEEFSICLIISNRELTSYRLDVIAPQPNSPPPASSSRQAPHRLDKDVWFFATARMKERMLIFYKRKQNLHNTTFHVLEPEQNTTQHRRGFGFRRGASGLAVTFRVFDEFYLPIECYSLNLFQSYIAVGTAKGFELLTLDKKQPISIPDLRQAHIANIASRVRDQRPLGMFKLNAHEFLLAYEYCAVYVDKHGDVSRTLIMEYSGKQKKATAATMYGPYLVLFNEDYVEVRDAENGRLRQIIAGRDVRPLDFGARGPTGMNGTPQNAQLAGNWTDPEYSKGTVKITMSHPETPGRQIILELVLNPGHNNTQQRQGSHAAVPENSRPGGA